MDANVRTHDPGAILRSSKVAVSPATFTLVSLAVDEFSRLLANAELSPRGAAPYMIFADGFEVTLLLDAVDFGVIRPALSEARTEGGFRMLTFDVELGFDIFGFIALVSKILADASVPVIPLSAFSRDHVLIKQDSLAAALRALGPHVAELC